MLLFIGGVMLGGIVLLNNVMPLGQPRAGTASYTLRALFGFVFIPVALWLGLPILHRRGFGSLFGPFAAAIRDFRKCLPLLVLVFAVQQVLYLSSLDSYRSGLEFGTWLLLVPLSLSAILIQTSAEELLFRGYILQQIAVILPGKWAWMGLSSLLFGLLHYDPVAQGSAAYFVAIWASLFGLAAADLTYRSGNIGAAIALHFVINSSALMFVSLPGAFSGLALLQINSSLEELASDTTLLFGEMVVLLIGWLACRLALRR